MVICTAFSDYFLQPVSMLCTPFCMSAFHDSDLNQLWHLANNMKSVCSWYHTACCKIQCLARQGHNPGPVGSQVNPWLKSSRASDLQLLLGHYTSAMDVILTTAHFSLVAVLLLYKSSLLVMRGEDWCSRISAVLKLSLILFVGQYTSFPLLHPVKSLHPCTCNHGSISQRAHSPFLCSQCGDCNAQQNTFLHSYLLGLCE